MKKPEISIIIPILKSSESFGNALESIMLQSIKNYEVIVVAKSDSPDLQKLKDKYRFKLVISGLGKSAARNYGSKVAEGKYLLHIDDDMTLDANVLQECIKTIKKSDIRAVSIPEVQVNKHGYFNRVVLLEKELASRDLQILAPRFISKELYEELGGMDENLDPIDEGDLKAKLDERDIRYTSCFSNITITPSSRYTLKSRYKRVFERGQKEPLFRQLHPESSQLKAKKRLNAYLGEYKYLLRQPVTALSLGFLKTYDLIVFKHGSRKVTDSDKKLISDLKNQNIFNAEADSYQKEFFEQTIGARYVNKTEQDIVKSYLKDIDRDKPLKILDIGAGGGRWSELMLTYFPNSTVTAADLSPDMVKNLRTKFASHGSRFNAVVADMQDLPFDNDTFDLINCIRAMKYAQDQQKVFCEMNRVLKSDGRIIVELPYPNMIYKLIRAVGIFGKLSSYAKRINIVDRHALQNELFDASFDNITLNSKFAIPATFYKNTNNRFVLAVINVFNAILPKRFFGRSYFIAASKAPSRHIPEHALISIILVNYNGHIWNKACIDSLLAQSYTNFEIIFVDNGSTDESLAFVQGNYIDERLRIVISSANLGFAGGNNLGINSAHGSHILLINNDTTVSKDFLRDVIYSYNKHDVDVIAPKELDYDGNELPYSDDRTIDILGHPYFKLGRVKYNFYLQGICILFSKDLYLSTKGLDTDFFMYFEETDWFWRLNLLRKTYAMDTGITIRHVGSGTSGKGIQYNTFLWRNQNTLQMLIKNFHTYTLIWILPVYFLQNVVEVLFFLLTLKPKIAYTYIQGWVFNLRNIRSIRKKHQLIQQTRLITDSSILQKMYHGTAKLQHLIYFAGEK